MRIIHLSDLHFGGHDVTIAKSLAADIAKQAPDLLVVSGDFAQIGSREEFETARTFLDDLNLPIFAVPGNHDLPARNVFLRLFDPYRYCQRFVAEDLEPTMTVGPVTLVGINTARRMRLGLNWANGSISTEQLRSLSNRFASAPADTVRIVVAHHPMLQPEQAMSRPMQLVKRADAALSKFNDLGVRLVLSGHFHVAYSRIHQSVEAGLGRPSLTVLQAASAISTRL